jgi:hypothetical protein
MLHPGGKTQKTQAASIFWVEMYNKNKTFNNHRHENLQIFRFTLQAEMDAMPLDVRRI